MVERMVSGALISGGYKVLDYTPLYILLDNILPKWQKSQNLITSCSRIRKLRHIQGPRRNVKSSRADIMCGYGMITTSSRQSYIRQNLPQITLAIDPAHSGPATVKPLLSLAAYSPTVAYVKTPPSLFLWRPSHTQPSSSD